MSGGQHPGITARTGTTLENQKRTRREDTQMFRNRLPYSISLTAALTLAGGLLLSCMLFLGVARLESGKTTLNFRQLAETRFTAANKGLDDAVIVMSIIALAHNLKLHVIPERVETQQQLDYLQQHGCDEMQGYFFSRPLPAAEFEQLLRQGKHLSGIAATLML